MSITQADLENLAKLLGDLSAGKKPEANARLDALAQQAVDQHPEGREWTAEEVEAWASRLATDLAQFCD